MISSNTAHSLSLHCMSRLMTLCAISATACFSISHAQTPPAPSSLFQYSTMGGFGNTITTARVPIFTATGTMIYKDVTLQFDVDADGNLTLSAGYPQVVDSPTPLMSSFRAGVYIGSSPLLSNGTVSTGKSLVNISGPGVSDGGATQWSLSVAAEADPCTSPGSASWYVGPIANSPYAARLKKAGITSTAMSYGVLGTAKIPGSCRSVGSAWENGVLIGVSQTGNALAIVTFTRCGGCNDDSAPIDQITYRLLP